MKNLHFFSFNSLFRKRNRQYPVLIKFKILGIDIVQESDKLSFVKEIHRETGL
jgi:hypothetical protein